MATLLKDGVSIDSLGKAPGHSVLFSAQPVSRRTIQFFRQNMIDRYAGHNWTLQDSLSILNLKNLIRCHERFLESMLTTIKISKLKFDGLHFVFMVDGGKNSWYHYILY